MEKRERDVCRGEEYRVSERGEDERSVREGKRSTWGERERKREEESIDRTVVD